MSESYPYESYCPHCQVSHPPGTRRCLHCGNRVVKERPPLRPGWQTSVPSPTEVPEHAPAEHPEDLGHDETEEVATPRRSSGPLRLAISLVWILAAVAITVYRACTGQ